MAGNLFNNSVHRIRHFAFQEERRDPVTFAVAGALLAIVGAGGDLRPRITRDSQQPLAALRAD